MRKQFYTSLSWNISKCTRIHHLENTTVFTQCLFQLFAILLPKHLHPPMFKISFQKQLVLGFTLSLFIVISINYLSYDSIRNLTKNADLVNHTQQVLNSSQEVLTMVL